MKLKPQEYMKLVKLVNTFFEQNPLGFYLPDSTWSKFGTSRVITQLRDIVYRKFVD